jgi:hypothetical protein
MWKKLFKGWTVSFEVWSGGEVDRGTENCKHATQANRLTLVWGSKADLGSGNPRGQRSGADGKPQKNKKREREEGRTRVWQAL